MRKKRLCMDRRALSGFSLIELVMVIVVIGILAVIALPKFINMRRDAQNAAYQGQIASLRSAITIYYSKSATDRFACLCLAKASPGNCNSYRNFNVSSPCFPANQAELAYQLSAYDPWVVTGGICYNETTGANITCP